MEAGNRCFDDRVPEEINRRIIDHSSTVLMPYTHRSKENLLREGIERERIFVTGNPIFEVMEANAEAIDRSDVLARLGVRASEYFLVTLHRAENVDVPARLRLFMDGLARIAREHDAPVLVSVHPRTAARLQQHEVAAGERVRLLNPLGFHDFVRLERSARAVLSDSGTVQEECCILGVPNVTLRDVTERAETIECGSNILSGVEPDAVSRSLRVALSTSRGWTPPAEYVARDVSRTVTKIVLGYASVRRHVSPA
jgi:UDP-N-acetylglucosamine 2-epimerase (non-hydrolysing)